MTGSGRVVGVYGSPEKAESMGLRVSEQYGGLDPEAARWARERGLRYIPLIWVPETRNPSEGVVNVYGGRGLFAFNNSGCISNPRIRQRLLERIEEAATRLEAEAVILDAPRFPSPHDKTLLYSCFCPHCIEKMKSLGINPEELRRRLLRLVETLHKYPHLDPETILALHTWTVFRQHVVKELLEAAREKAKSHGLELWAAVFPPSLAWLVGQNYEVLRHLLDEVHVMLYHRCSGPACLNHELQSLAELVGGEHTRITLRMLTGIDVENPTVLDAEGLDTKVIVEEARRARTLLGEKAVPILQLDEQGLKIAKNLRDSGKIAYLVLG